MHEDLSNAIFSINSSKENNEKNVFYTTTKYSKHIDSNNNHIMEKDSESVFAKKLHLQGRWKFFIRIDENNMTYNPYNIYGNYSPKKNLINKPSEQQIRFKETSNNIFERYLSFLQNQNMSIYNNVNREII